MQPLSLDEWPFSQAGCDNNVLLLACWCSDSVNLNPLNTSIGSLRQLTEILTILNCVVSSLKSWFIYSAFPQFRLATLFKQ